MAVVCWLATGSDKKSLTLFLFLWLFSLHHWFFSNWTVWTLVWFCLLYLEFVSFTVCNLHQMWTSFSHYFFKYCFHCFLFFWNSSYVDLKSIDFAPQVTNALSLCSVFLILCTIFWIISIAMSWSSLISSVLPICYQSLCFSPLKS